MCGLTRKDMVKKEDIRARFSLCGGQDAGGRDGSDTSREE